MLLFLRAYAVLWSPNERTLIERIPAYAPEDMVESVKAAEPETQSTLEADGAAA
jgi:hypothetical protein